MKNLKLSLAVAGGTTVILIIAEIFAFPSYSNFLEFVQNNLIVGLVVFIFAFLISFLSLYISSIVKK